MTINRIKPHSLHQINFRTMQKILSTLILFLFLQLTSNAQYTVKGTLKDTTARSFLEKAVVAIVDPTDSTLLSFTRTDAKGNYLLQTKKPGKYTLMVMHPQYGDYVEIINVTEAENNIPAIALTSRITLLETVIVNSTKSMRVKGDTTIYTADSFKVSANANVEELLKKLPGLQVDKDGKITAMGQAVQKVLVDGEEFFGADPGMAVKNLRADAVKEVQVFDKKSEQAEFTGIDDGNTQKTINLKLKESAKNGYFGKLDAAGGLQKEIDDRYNTNVLYSTFKGQRKLSGFLLNGNTGQDGLSWEDRDKYGGDNDNMTMTDDGFMFTSGGSSDGEPYINTDNGFTTNTNAGISYSNKYDNKQKINFSPKYNSQIYDNTTRTFSQTQLQGDSVLNSNSARDYHVDRNNLKLRGRADLYIDSSNSIVIDANANFYKTESIDRTLSETRGKNGNLKNTSDRFLRTDSDKDALNASVLFKHKFAKLKRTLTVNLNANKLSTSGQNILITENKDFVNNINIPVNQQFDNDKNTTNTGAKVVYTEPLGKRYAVEVGHEINFTKGFNDQTTFSYVAATGKYENRVDSLTNNFEQKIITNKPSAKLSYSFKKLKWYTGIGFGITKFDFLDKTFDKEYNRDFTNVFPEAGLTYSYKTNASLRFNYNGATSQPSLNQLQPLRNNNDQFNLYIGNPNLKQSFSNRFNLSHNSYDFLKDRWMYQSIGYTVTSNSITNSRTIDPVTGKTTTQPVNTDGNQNMYFYGGLGQKLKKSDIRLGVNINGSYSRYADFINGQESFAKTTNAGLGISLSKSKEKKYEWDIRNDVNFNANKNAQFTSTNSYRTYELNAEGRLYYKKVWSLRSEYKFTTRQKTEQSTGNLTNQLWNATLERTFKKDEFTAYFKVRDILNTNVGIDRRFGGNTYTETINDRLQRYFLLGFTWNFKNKSKAAAAATTTPNP